MGVVAINPELHVAVAHAQRLWKEKTNETDQQTANRWFEVVGDVDAMEEIANPI